MIQEWGLYAPGPDLVHNAPFLEKLKKGFPGYVARAEQAQVYARDIARDIILPKSLELDELCALDPTHVDWELWRQLNRKKAGICLIPEAMGGLGWGFLDMFAAMEELVAADVSTTAFFMFNLFGPVCAFVEFRPDICLAMINDLVSAQRRDEPLFFAWALTEPACGTDNLNEQACRTQRPTFQVRRVQGGYRLDGSKHFISNGSLAKAMIVVAPVDPEKPLETMACFYVTADSPGFSVGRVEKKMGHRAKQTAQLLFADVFVPDKNVWEKPGRGWRHTMEVLAVSTGAVGMLSLGLARGALERCIRYCRRETHQGRPLIEENRVRLAIADMFSKIMTVRAKLLDFAIGADALLVTRLLDKPYVRTALAVLPERLLLGESLRTLAASPRLAGLVSRFKHAQVPDEVVSWFKAQGACVKVAGSDLAVEVSSRVLDIVGLKGAAHCHGMEKIFRDAKVTQIYEGANQVNLLALFEHEFGGNETNSPAGTANNKPCWQLVDNIVAGAVVSVGRQDDLFLRECRRFAEKVAAPGCLEADKHRDHAWALDVFQRSAELDLPGLLLPESEGGVGEGLFLAGLVVETFSRTCASVGMVLAGHYAACAALAAGGIIPSPETASLADDLNGKDGPHPLVLVFPAPGSDDWPELEMVGGELIVSGRAAAVPGAALAGLLVIIVRHGPKAALAVVRPDDDGVTLGPDLKLPGLCACPHADVVFERASVSGFFFFDDRAGAGPALEEGRRAFYALTAAVAGGLAEAAAENADEYARGRYQFGRVIINHSEIKRMLGMMRQRLSVGRSAWREAVKNGADSCRRSVNAKCFCVDGALETAADAVQIMGGYGYMHEYGMEKRLRDAKTLQLEGGSTSCLMTMTTPS
ncbi:MAG: acyl-CoA dehydrogenase family protein [Desulfosudaceae bacterium]